jgi:hypothetical protein
LSSFNYGCAVAARASRKATKFRNKFSCSALLNTLVSEQRIISAQANSTSWPSFSSNYGD